MFYTLNNHNFHRLVAYPKRILIVLNLAVLDELMHIRISTNISYLFTINEKKNYLLTAVRVGKTQSNISIPRETQTTKSAANPTPIRYLGLSLGKKSVHK